jgi:hypothetical protein
MVKQGNIKRSTEISELVTRFLGGKTHWSRMIRRALDIIRNPIRSNNWEAFLFGGVPRRLWLEGTSPRLRDIDVVVEDAAFPHLEQYISDNARRNRFGGFKCVIEGVTIDLWPLSTTWAFRESLVRDISFKALPTTTFLNVDSIVVELAPRPGQKRRYFESGFFKALRTRELDICLEPNPYPLLSAVRALRLAEVMGFTLSQRLSEYTLRVILGSSFKDLEAIQKHHYSQVLYSAARLIQIAEALQLKLQSGKADTISLFSIAHQPELWPEHLLPMEIFEFYQRANYTFAGSKNT